MRTYYLFIDKEFCIQNVKQEILEFVARTFTNGFRTRYSI